MLQEKLFHFWFNTYFVCEPAVTENGNGELKHCGQNGRAVLDDSPNLHFPNNKIR